MISVLPGLINGLDLQNALRQQRFVREVTIQYNLCNEPWCANFPLSFRFILSKNLLI